MGAVLVPELDAHVADARLPVLGRGPARVVLGAGDPVVDDAGDAAVGAVGVEEAVAVVVDVARPREIVERSDVHVFDEGARRLVGRLAPHHDRALADEALEALEEEERGLGSRFRPEGQPAVVRLQLRVEHLGWNEASRQTGLRLPVVGIRTAGAHAAGAGMGRAGVTAIVDDDRKPRRMVTRVVDLGDHPREEREDFVEGLEAAVVGAERLVDGPVAEPDVQRLVGNARLAVLTDAVAVPVFEHEAVEVREPAEDRDVPHGLVGAVHVDHGAADDQVEGGVEHHELVAARRHVRDRERAVLVRGLRVEQVTARGPRVESHPWPRVGERRAAELRHCDRPRLAQVRHATADGEAPCCRQGVRDACEADFDVGPGRPELGEELGLVGLHPRVDAGLCPRSWWSGSTSGRRVL